MAHKKGAGSTRNGRDSNSQRRGVKVYGGEEVRAGNILVRQVGSSIAPGQERRARQGLHALRARRRRREVRVAHEKQRKVSVYPELSSRKLTRDASRRARAPASPRCNGPRSRSTSTGRCSTTRGQPHERDVRALRAALRAGVHVSILTGRLYSGTRAAAEAARRCTGPSGAPTAATSSTRRTTRRSFTTASHGPRTPASCAMRSRAHGPADVRLRDDAIVPRRRGARRSSRYVRTWSHRRPRAPARRRATTSGDATTGSPRSSPSGTAEQIHGTRDETGAGARPRRRRSPCSRCAASRASWGLIARACRRDQRDRRSRSSRRTTAARLKRSSAWGTG